MHQDDVHREPMQPGRKRRLATKRSNLSKQLQERFLGQILGLGRIRSHPQAQRINAPLVLVVKGLERRGVSLLCPFDPLGFDWVALLLFWVGQVAFSGRTP